MNLPNFTLAYCQLYETCRDHSTGIVKIDSRKYPSLAQKLWNCHSTNQEGVELTDDEYDDLMNMNHVTAPHRIDAFLTIYLD